MKKESCFFKTKPIKLLSKYDRWRVRAKLIGISKSAQMKLEWFIYYETKAKGNASLVCRHFGLTRKTFHKWKNRFDEARLVSLEEHSRTPYHVRQPDYTSQQVIRVEKLRETYVSAGGKKLAVLYREDYNLPISTWTMERIIRDKSLYALRAITSPRQQAQANLVKKKRLTELVKQAYQGFLVEADGITIYFAGQKRYVFTVIDYHSRIAFAYMYTSKGSRNAADFLRRLVLLFGGNIENIHIDNGSEFKKDFVKAAKKLKITLYHARPYHPQDKPFIERFNGNLQQEWIDLGHFTLDTETFNRNLMDYLVYYNFKRPHHSLGLKRPMEIAMLTTQNNTNQVLPMYSNKTWH